MRLAPIPLAELSEKDLQRQVFDLLKVCGFKRAYHTFDSRKSAKGFPDVLAVRERLVWLELKSESGKLSPAQKEWLAALIAAGAEVYLIRPRDLEALAKVLAQRGDPFMARGEIVDVAARLRDSLRLELGEVQAA